MWTFNTAFQIPPAQTFATLRNLDTPVSGHGPQSISDRDIQVAHIHALQYSHPGLPRFLFGKQILKYLRVKFWTKFQKSAASHFQQSGKTHTKTWIQKFHSECRMKVSDAFWTRDTVCNFGTHILSKDFQLAWVQIVECRFCKFKFRGLNTNHQFTQDSALWTDLERFRRQRPQLCAYQTHSVQCTPSESPESLHSEWELSNTSGKR